MITAKRFTNAIDLTEKLYQVRADTRQMMGDNYRGQVGQLAALLKEIAEQRGQGYLETMHELAGQTEVAGRMAVVAAYVELCEASGRPELLQKLLAERRTPQ